MLLDEFSYSVISKIAHHDRIFGDNIIDISDLCIDLSRGVKSLLVSECKKFLDNNYSDYIDEYNLEYVIPSESWDQAFSNIDFFTNKTIKSVKNDIESKFSISINKMSIVKEIVPVEKGRGIYHGRFKTMFYMLLLSFANSCFKEANQHNGFESMIQDFSGHDTDGLISKNQKFNSLAKKTNPLWNDGMGHHPPSYFGSKQIIIPDKNQ